MSRSLYYAERAEASREEVVVVPHALPVVDLGAYGVLNTRKQPEKGRAEVPRSFLVSHNILIYIVIRYTTVIQRCQLYV